VTKRAFDTLLQEVMDSPYIFITNPEVSQLRKDEKNDFKVTFFSIARGDLREHFILQNRLILA